MEEWQPEHVLGTLREQKQLHLIHGDSPMLGEARITYFMLADGEGIGHPLNQKLLPSRFPAETLMMGRRTSVTS